MKKVVREDESVVIRQDWRIPYSSGAGFNTEFWLSTRGEVIVMISKQLTGGINWHFTEHKGWFSAESLSSRPAACRGHGRPMETTSTATGGPTAASDSRIEKFGWYFKPGRVDPNPPEIWDGSGINDLKDVRTDGAEEGDAALGMATATSSPRRS